MVHLVEKDTVRENWRNKKICVVMVHLVGKDSYYTNYYQTSIWKIRGRVKIPDLPDIKGNNTPSTRKY